MPAKIIDGKAIAQGIRAELKAKVDSMAQKPGLAIVIAGENQASQTYVRLKIKACDDIGITSEKHELPENVSEDELLGLIEKLNKDPNIHGIIVQMPLPKQIDSAKVITSVSPEKDVDGFHPINLGGLLTETAKFESATAKGIMRLLAETGIKLKGKDICLIGWGITVGKPLSNMLLAKNATLTVCHEFTKDLPAHTKNADVIITATGVPNLIKAGMVKEGAIIIDAGCGMSEGKLCGDVDFEAVRAVASWITPVPGGVGPMTIAMLLSNVVDASA